MTVVCGRSMVAAIVRTLGIGIRGGIAVAIAIGRIAIAIFRVAITSVCVVVTIAVAFIPGTGVIALVAASMGVTVSACALTAAPALTIEQVS
jgi:hypothetical protein